MVRGWAPCLTAFSAVQGGLDYLVLNHIGTNRFQEWTGDVEYTRWLMQVRLHQELGESGFSWDSFGKLQGKAKPVAMVENNPFTSFTFQVKHFGGFVAREVFCLDVVHL